MTEAFSPILGAALGAAGAISAQIVAALFTARRETKRNREEQFRYAADDTFRHEQLFADVKRSVYTRLLVLAEDRWRTLDSIRYNEAGVVEGELLASRDRWWNEWSSVTTEATLINRDLAEVIDELHESLNDWEEGVLEAGELDSGPYYEPIREKMKQLRESLSDDLLPRRFIPSTR